MYPWACAWGFREQRRSRNRVNSQHGRAVAPLAAYESYYRERAQLWEIHALTRARPIAGPLQNDYIEIAQQTWREVGQQPDLFGKIDNMLERIQKERGSGLEVLDFKTGVGGMIEAEFLVQALQMHAGIWEPNWEKALAALKEAKVVSDLDATKTTESYDFLRRIELALRRFENKNVSTLPAAPDEQARLARRLGQNDRDHFVKQYQAARETIQALYQHYIKARL